MKEFNKRLMDYLVWFNTKRPHESLGDISPIQYVLKYHPECHMYATCTIYLQNTLLMLVFYAYEWDL